MSAFTREKKPYAQKIIADEIMKKYEAQEKTLGYALNVFALGIEEGDIKPLADAKHHQQKGQSEDEMSKQKINHRWRNE